jgi:uncharacterized protein (TIGR02246 family)
MSRIPVPSQGLPLVLALTVAAVAGCKDRSEPVGSSQELAPPASGVVANLAGIQALVDAQFAAWNAKDAAAVAAVYAVDATFIDPIGAVLEGRAEIRERHAYLFAGPFAGSTEVQVITRVRMLTGTLAVVHLATSLTGYAFLAPGVRPTEPGVLRVTKTWVVQKRAGSWSILAQQITFVPPSP